MNARWAVEYLGTADVILGSKLDAFLHSSFRSIDLTPESFRSKPCLLSAEENGKDPSDSDRSGCHSEYFLAGELMFVIPEALNDPNHSGAGVLLAENHRGLYLQFEAGRPNVSFNSTRDCRVYHGRYWGIDIGANLLCVVNTAPNQVNASKLNLIQFMGNLPRLTNWINRAGQMPRNIGPCPNLPQRYLLA